MKELFVAGRYVEAANVSLQQYQLALQRRDYPAAVAWLNDIAGCHFAMFQYRQAMRYYLEARSLAARIGNWDHAAALGMNTSSLYLQLGEVRAAFEAAQDGLRSLGRARDVTLRPLLLLQLGQVYFRMGESGKGTEIYRTGIEEAAQRGDSTTQARGWDRLGWELLFAGDVTGAERALVEAYRLRLIGRSREIILCYPKLGLLRLAQGDLRSAEVFLDKSVRASSASASTIPPWSVYHSRGELRLAQGRLEEALSDFRTARELARRWKIEVLPADSVRLAAGVGLQQIYSSLIQTGNRLYFASGDRRLAAETWETAEENRAWALNTLRRGRNDRRDSLPQDYWQSLARLQKTEASLLAKDDPDRRRQAQRLRASLTEMETRAGLEAGSGGSVAPGTDRPAMLARFQRGLAPDEALLSFHLSDAESCVWAVTSDRLELHRLPGLDHLSSLARRFRQAVFTGSPEAAPLGESLYTTLFGGSGKQIASKAHWILVLDDVLHQAPLSALVVGRDGARPIYLIERHSLRTAPSAALLAGEGSRKLDASFVGIGDAIYNTADPRWRASESQNSQGWQKLFTSIPSLRAANAADHPPQLARLVASDKEIRRCAEAWSGEPSRRVLLTGRAASIASLENRLAGGPSILHFATHVRHSPREPSQAALAMSLYPDGEGEFLTAERIASWRYPLGLVVMSACSSGSYQSSAEPAALRRATKYALAGGRSERLTPPGEGLLGLTRAWLAAGARGVIASHWSTPDDTGDLFLSFYTHLRGLAGSGQAARVACALQLAQLDSLRSGAWRSQPRYWAAFFITGRE